MNIGDNVKVTAYPSQFHNLTGFIVDIMEGSELPYTVVFDKDGIELVDYSFFSEDELEVVS